MNVSAFYLVAIFLQVYLLYPAFEKIIKKIKIEQWPLISYYCHTVQGFLIIILIIVY